MHSFIITLTYRSKPVIFRFVSNNQLEDSLYTVSALNDRELPAFLMEQQNGQWKIVSEVPGDIRQDLEPRLSLVIKAYLEGQQ